MKYKIGVFGSGNNTVSGEVIETATRKVGAALGARANEVIVITGACSGLPYIAANAAAKGGAEVMGFSPVCTIEEQQEFTPNDDLKIYSKIQFIPKEASFADNRRVCMKYRNVLSTAACDAGIIVSGRWGSMNEFTNLIDMQKVVGVLTGTGGIADELPALHKKIFKEGQGTVIFNSDPEALIAEVLEQVKSA